MFPSPQSGLSLMKIIGGISKSLSVAQQIIPIYEQTKPMIQNARKAFSVLREINIPKPKANNSSSQTVSSQQKTIAQNSNSFTNNPSFFK
ncbi:MAG: hypothetical protein IJO63_02825 [Bacilli bacterium]|nr:hypothetical protein [Bacilli bacterium]